MWSTYWIFIKIGLEDIPAPPFAGMRYALALLVLVPFVLRRPQLAALRGHSRKSWTQLILLGLIFYGVTQGSQFVGLFYLPAITVSLMLSFTPMLVALMGGIFLGEKLTTRQRAGIGLYIIGVLIFFCPAVVPAGQVIGLVVVLAGVPANATSSILGRNVNQQLSIPAEVVTVVSMGFGALALLILGSAVQGLPRLNMTSWAIILWLAIVNSA